MVLPEIALSIVLLVDALLLAEVISGLGQTNWLVWSVLHIVCSCLTAFFCLQFVRSREKWSMVSSAASSQTGLWGAVFVFALFIPGVGGLGMVLALVVGIHQSSGREYGQRFWQVTEVAELPFTSPKGRLPTRPDSRGIAEHLIYSSDDDDIYRKVLAAANIKASLAIEALKQAMRHHDERVRLTAYKALDGKVEELNQKIRDLELRLEDVEPDQRSETWLQIASNYWELVTLGGSEPIAREHLLDKATEYSIKAVAALSSNRNAHYLLGRVSLVKGDTVRAKVALQQSRNLGMPAEKVIPYLAECAYVERDYPAVNKLLSRLDPAVIAYPPLSHVASYWT